MQVKKTEFKRRTLHPVTLTEVSALRFWMDTGHSVMVHKPDGARTYYAIGVRPRILKVRTPLLDRMDAAVDAYLKEQV